MNNVASRLLHDALANSLGRILDISREQLNVSLWSAWRTGLTLEDVALRRDAFEHLQLPFTLRSGRIGRIQVQVPWATLRSLRSPVVVELDDVHLTVVLRRDEELEEVPAGERAWLAKQAELAAAELAALAAASDGGGGDAAATTTAGRQGGVLESLMRHVVSTLVNRLQLTVTKVHITFEDPQTGTCIGLQLSRLHTCRPGEAEHASLLLAEDAGVLVHGAAAARGTVQKQLAVQGLALYWQPGRDSSDDPEDEIRIAPAEEGGPHFIPTATAGAEQAPPRRHKPPTFILQPTDCVLHASLQLSAPDGIRAHAAAVIRHLPLNLDGRQVADVFQLMDRLAWCSARTKFAAYCPSGWRRPGPRTVPWRRVWQFAVNAVLHELRGERQGAVPWRDGAALAALRKRYVAAYRLFLEQEVLEGGGLQPSQPCKGEAGRQLQALERQLSVNDILGCRHAARRVLDASLAASSGMGAAVEDAGGTRSVLGRVQPHPPSLEKSSAAPSRPAAAAAPVAAAPGTAAPAAVGSQPASFADSSSVEGSSSDGSGRRRGYLAWGLSRAAGFLRYLPYSTPGEGANGSATALAEPTEAELAELYEAVDFHPEEQAAAAAAASTATAAAPGDRVAAAGTTGLHFSLDLLVSSASLLLLERGVLVAVEQQQAQRQHQQQQEEADAWPSSPDSGHPSGCSSGESSVSSIGGAEAAAVSIATLELEQLRLGLQVQPDGTTATLRLVDISAHDLCSDGPGISSLLLSSGAAAAAAAAAGSSQAGSARSRPPVMRLSFASAPQPAQGAEQRPQLDVLVQPLLLHPRSFCMQRLLALIPPALLGSFNGLQLSALNALSAEARCVVKARSVAKMGPPVDLLVKVLDVALGFGGIDSHISPRVLLHTGPMTLHSVDPEQVAAAAQQQQWQRQAQGDSPPKAAQQQQQQQQQHQPRQVAPGHRLTAAEAEAHLSAVIRQRRAAARFGGAAAAAVGKSPAAAGATGAILDAAAAVAAVERHLVYQQFELSVSDLRASATKPQPLPGDGGSGAAACQGSANADSSGDSHRVLKPLRLAGWIKMHRIGEDYALPQFEIALQADPVSLSLTQSVVQMFIDWVSQRPTPQQHQQAVAAAAAAARGNARRQPPAKVVVPDLSPSSVGGKALPCGAGSSDRGVAVISLDVQLASLDLSCAPDSLRTGGGAAAGGGSQISALEARIACAGASLALKSFLDGTTIQFTAARLLVHDQCPNHPQQHLPPPVHGGPVPRFARLLTAEQLNVSYSGRTDSAAGCASGGPESDTLIALHDVAVEGFAGEAGNFLARLHERQATQLDVTIQDTPAVLHTTISANNVLMGHGLLLRYLAFLEPPPQDKPQQEQQAQQQGATAAGAAAALSAGGFVQAEPAGAVELPRQHVMPSPEAASDALDLLQPDPGDASWGPGSGAEAVQGQSCSSAGSVCVEAGGEIDSRPPMEGGDLARAEQQQQSSTPADSPLPPAEAAAPPPAKQTLTSIFLTDCRLALRYQPAMHAGHGVGSGGSGSGSGSLHGSGGGGSGPLAGAGIPPATHDFLSVHSDLLSLDMPLLRLQLPLHAEGMAAASRVAVPAPDAAATPLHSPEKATLSPSGISQWQSRAPAFSKGTTSPPATLAGSGISWGETPAPAPIRCSPVRVSFSERRQPWEEEQKQLLEGSRLTLWGAAVGYARHSMLPLLQVPRAALTCTAIAGGGDSDKQAACSTSRRKSQNASSLGQPRSVSAGGSPMTPPAGGLRVSTAAEADAGSSPCGAGSVALSYCLELAAVDVGLHPSQLGMLTSAVQLWQHEMAVLTSEPADDAAADTESAITATSAGQVEAQQQQQAGAARGRPTDAAGSPAAPAAASRDADATEQASAAAGHVQWRLDAALRCVGVSLLGATASSSCLKLEWHGLRATCSAGTPEAASSPLDGSPLGQRQSPVVPGDNAGSSRRGGGTGAMVGVGSSVVAASLSWSQLAAHVLHPRLSLAHPDGTCFAFPAAALGAGVELGDSSQLLHAERDTRGSPPPTSPHIFASTTAAPPPPFGQGAPPSRGGGVRRSLSAGLGLAGSATDEFQDAAVYLSRASLGSSRYYSLTGSEFEDAASELEGAQSPTAAHGSPVQLPLPLPLPLDGGGYDCYLLLLLYGQAAAAEAAVVFASPASVSSSRQAPTLGAEPSAAGLDASWCAAGGGSGGGTMVSFQLTDRRAALAVDTLALRVHTAGWEDAAHCLHTYLVLAEQAQQQYASAADARAALHAAPRRPRAATPSAAPSHAAAAGEEGLQQHGMSLQLQLQSFLVDVVADAEQQHGEQVDMHEHEHEQDEQEEEEEEEEQEQEDEVEERPGTEGSVRRGARAVLVPACSLQTTQLALELEQGGDCGTRLKLTVPGLLLAVGVLPATAAAATAEQTLQPPAALGLPLSDALLGWSGLELNLLSQQQQCQVQPAATSAEGSVLLGAAHQVSVGSSLAQISLWGHSRNLCAAAALVGHASALARALADALPLGRRDRGPSTAKPPGSSPGSEPPCQLTCKLNVHKAAVLLSLLMREDAHAPAEQHGPLPEPMPLLELAVAAVTADLLDMGLGCLEGTVRGEVELAAFSSAKAGWEPVLEPWRCRLQATVPLAVPPPSNQHHRLSVSSAQGLELTVTQSALEAAVLAAGALQAAAAVAEEPGSLGSHLTAACGSATHSAAYWLHNQTGCQLELWLSHGKHDADAAASPQGSSSPHAAGSEHGSLGSSSPDGGKSSPGVPLRLPELVVQPGARVMLPVVAAARSRQHGLHVGSPCPQQGVVQFPPHSAHGSLQRSTGSRRGLAGLGAAPGTPGHPPGLSGLGAAAASADRPARQARTQLRFRLSGQEAVCGPLDLHGGSFHCCLGGTGSSPEVLCELEDAQHGGYTLTIHSGVQLRNTTPLALDVGVQTPMGLVMEPQALGTLRPGATLWLPVPLAHSGLLCLRPKARPGSRPPPRPHSRAPVGTHPAAVSAGSLQTAASWQPGDGSRAAASRIPSLATDSLAAAAALVAGSHAAAAALPPPMLRTPSSPLLYSTAGLASPARHGGELPDTMSRHASQPVGLGPCMQRADSWQAYEWSVAVPLQALLRQAAGSAEGGGRGYRSQEGRTRASRQLTCASVSDRQPPVLLCVGASRLSASAGTEVSAGSGSGAAGNGSGSASTTSGCDTWEVLLCPPLTLHNALPVPLDVLLTAWGQEHRLHLQPNQHAALHAVDAAQVESVTLRALGYHPSCPISPAPLTAAGGEGGGAGSAAAAQQQQQQHGQAGSGASSSAGSRELLAPDVEVRLRELGHSQSEASVFVRHSLDTATGSHTLLFGCTLWVFNCTGVPVALRQSASDLLFSERSDSGYQQLLEEEVPDCWLPPLELPGSGRGPGSQLGRSGGRSPLQHRLGTAAGLRAVSREGMREGMHSVLSTPNSAAPSVINASRVTSAADMAGFGDIMDGSARSARSVGLGSISLGSAESRKVLGVKFGAVSRARGIADSMEAAPAFETPTRWPGIQGGLHPQGQRLRLQIRATQSHAPPGRSYWSNPVELDALGGAAVVTVPSPLLPPTASIAAARAAYMMSVTASQVAGSHGALALYLLPRYLLINTLDVPVQYKQQGTQQERELLAGASCALRWSDVLRPLRLCVRMQEAGWLWSGGFELDCPGDLFIKIRHRDRGVTMLVRVDLATSAASGVLRITLSHHPAGFAPYRVENCSLETLHARQHKVREQQDVLRPYCSLNYAWDEPSLPHRLVLELPGSRVLGTFDLDQVGQDVLLAVPTKRGEPQRRVRVLVRTEGPTRVLTVLDAQRHSLPGERPGSAVAGGGDGIVASTRSKLSGWPPRGPWGAWSLPALGSTAVRDTRKEKHAELSGLLWEVCADLASLGVSLVAPTREVAYARATGVRVQLAGTAAHKVLELELRRLQLDNPSPWVALPVTLQIPAPISKLTSTVAAAVDVQRKPAVVARIALWQRRPAGVLCIEQADLQLAPVAIYVEQQHAMQLADFLTGLAAGLEAVTAAAAAAASAAGTDGGTHAGGPGENGRGGASGSDAAGFFSLPASSSLGAVASPATGLPGLSPDLEALLSGRGDAMLAPPEQKVYIDVLRIATLELSITFLPAPFHQGSGHSRLLALQRMLSLADIEDARLKLAALEVRSPLMGTSALAQLLQRHYTRALLPELYKVVGSASVFGDPVRLFHHLGLGVWSFLASPAAGLVESARQRGPRFFLSGLASGVRGLFQNVVFALSNAATKGSTAARKAITALGLDRLHPQHPWAAAAGPSFRRRLRWEQEAVREAAHAAPVPEGSQGFVGAAATANFSTSVVVFSPRDGTFDGPQPGGDGGVLGAVLLGVAGLAAEPIRGLDEGGLTGLLAGIKRGTIGVVVLPLASLLEMFASTAASIRRAVEGHSNVGWLRPPRFVHAALPLEPYSWAEAMGRWLLTELERFSLARTAHRAAAAAVRAGDAPPQPQPRHGAFVLCSTLAERSCFIVVTSKRVLHICAREPMWVPVVRWSCTIADLELVSTCGSHLRLVSQQPLRRHIVRRASMLPRSMTDARKAPRPPLSFLSIDCETEAAAAQLQMVLLQLQARIPTAATYCGHCLLLAAPDD